MFEDGMRASAVKMNPDLGDPPDIWVGGKSQMGDCDHIKHKAQQRYSPWSSSKPESELSGSALMITVTVSAKLRPPARGVQLVEGHAQGTLAVTGLHSSRDGTGTVLCCAVFAAAESQICGCLRGAVASNISPAPTWQTSASCHGKHHQNESIARLTRRSSLTASAASRNRSRWICVCATPNGLQS
jgi:hypothetical protein